MLTLGEAEKKVVKALTGPFSTTTAIMAVAWAIFYLALVLKYKHVT